MHQSRRELRKLVRPRENGRKKEEYTSAQDEISRWLAQRLGKALNAAPAAATVSRHQKRVTA